jgi:inner membrane protein
MDEGGYREGYHSILDDAVEFAPVHHPSERALLDSLQDQWSVRRLTWFTKGFYAVAERPTAPLATLGSASTLRQLLGMVESAEAAGDEASARRPAIVVTDVRMGQTPWFVFSFVVAERRGAQVVPVPARQVRMEPLPADVLGSLWPG